MHLSFIRRSDMPLDTGVPICFRDETFLQDIQDISAVLKNLCNSM